ncbi:hypothetical protein PHMEG_00031596 [Phytophthora megakarya]|uniref:Uncharacterized protein n=1 Tax=Phytophthora megakarya TaxID=4795 RepID=A0A225UYH8_9STRA|nr:hypothetical protein PHMEG_00031596 [Phytophthora megakarya]
MGQLGKRVRTNWRRLAREFKHECCKSRRADVKFRKSERRRKQHIKRFIKTLTDMSLRSTLQSQRFYKVSDLEYVLKQQEEVNASGGYSTRSPPPIVTSEQTTSQRNKFIMSHGGHTL